MAWFKKTLEDMKAAVDADDWKEVKRIYLEHKGHIERNKPAVEHDLTQISLDIEKYNHVLSQMRIAISNKSKQPKGEAMYKIDEAIRAAIGFEKTIIHLNKLGRFTEEEMK
jgi:hypothetical protein